MRGSNSISVSRVASRIGLDGVLQCNAAIGLTLGGAAALTENGFDVDCLIDRLAQASQNGVGKRHEQHMGFLRLTGQNKIGELASQLTTASSHGSLLMRRESDGEAVDRAIDRARYQPVAVD
ncbi:hypothetical protein D9M71_743770 [compost metagenome]